jgi:tetratricopeptide (TPR) repeat protein
VKSILCAAILLLSHCAFTQKQSTINAMMTEQQISKRFLENGAWKVSYFSPEYQLYLDSAIAAKPTMAYLYQQKAMPYFKQRKYEAGMVILDKAIELDAKTHIDYRAFIKCIFSKTYKDAIVDFEASKKIKGEHNMVMDHSYDFYIGLCHLQSNEFTKALSFLERSIEHTRKASGETWVHHLELFYAGIALQELGKHRDAIDYFNGALKHYARFSDVKYYKAISLYRTGQLEVAEQLLIESRKDLEEGFTINEDNAIYEKYPYQIQSYYVGAGRMKK